MYRKYATIKANSETVIANQRRVQKPEYKDCLMNPMADPSSSDPEHDGDNGDEQW
jgi:hypothetical protein